MANASPVAAPDGPPLAVVRLEVSAGNGRPALYEVANGGFLIGSVAGCDLRLPGSNQAPVLALISRHPGGATLRKLTPVQPVLVNSRPASSAYLNDGDRLKVGSVEIAISVQLPPATARTAPSPTPAAPPAPSPAPTAPSALLAQVEQLGAQVDKHNVERDRWQRRTQEIEAALRGKELALQDKIAQIAQAEKDLEAAHDHLEAREKVVETRQKQLEQAHVSAASLAERNEEVMGLRNELGAIRDRLLQRYRERRNRLAAREVSVHRAAKKVQERKRLIDATDERLATAVAELTAREYALEAGYEQLRKQRELIEEQQSLVSGQKQETQRDVSQKLDEIRKREQALAQERAELTKGQSQHQADLVRLDRLQASLDQRQAQLQKQALEVDKRFEQLQRDSRELEEQAAQVDDWHSRHAAGSDLLAAQKQEQESVGSQLEQRAAALETQQAMLATLRTRLERTREEVRRQEQALTEQRALQETSAAELAQQLAGARQLRENLETDRLMYEHERAQFNERRATLDAAVAQMRATQDALDAEQTTFALRQKQFEADAAEQADNAERLLARGTQLEEMHTRLTADRQAMREREIALTRSEQTLTTLQEQLRRRNDELAEQQTRLVERETKLADKTTLLQARAEALEQEHGEGTRQLEAVRQSLASRTAELDQLSAELGSRAETYQAEAGRLEENARAVNSARQQLATERIAFETERQAARAEAERAQEGLEAARRDAVELASQLAELEDRAGVGMERLLRAREALREHLAEVHTYARQSRDDLEAARREVAAEVERVRQQEIGLHSARDEHRLAVAAFRHQLIEWQSQVGEMRQALQSGEVQLDRRQAEVEQKAQQVQTVTARLAAEAERLQEEHRRVAVRRGEVDRHLEDMRSWYRQKIRELSGIDAEPATPGASAGVLPMPSIASGASTAADEDDAVLSMTGEIEPADRKLGDLLHSLELVDGDTLQALLQEARRQRRSLRQLLLAGGYLTLYQMALIETGNLDGLVLGPVRVIDRLPTTPREAVYRVFDPRHNREALLRHLAESEMVDAVRPDEFRQRFAAAMVEHPHLAATWEIFELAGRPAVLQECPVGLAGNDWPTLAAAPGVWFRLLSQAAQGVRALHEAGLVHGHLTAESFVCTREGVVKIIGIGQPHWLVGVSSANGNEATAAGDLQALGQVALLWGRDAPRKTGKAKQLPEALLAMAQRLGSEDVGQRFESATALLDEMDRLRDQVPPNGAAWERFVKQVRDESAEQGLRRSA